MRPVYKLGMVLLAGVALGGLAVEGLHAQAKRPVYFIAEIDVKNPDAYAKEYAPKAQAIIKAAGGRFVAIGGTAGNLAGQITPFEGDPPKRVVVQVWDSLDQVKAWRASPEYVALKKVGDKYATFRSFAVDAAPE